MQPLCEKGKVYLVGAGPGDPDLLTLRGAELLKNADVVFYDGLVNPLLMRLASGRTERTARTRTDGRLPVVPQADVNDRLIQEARQGRSVVRLKGGDPYIFGRGSEEAQALESAGIPYEVVPGITAATAAGVYAGFSFTHRDHASAVAFITGQETPDRPDRRLDYDALARFPGTLVFYMGLARLETICRSLMENGRPADTPAAVISRASLAAQRVVTGPLSDLADRVAAADMKAPSLIVIGECVNQRKTISWFEQLPLFGQRIGITRSEHQMDDVIRSVVRQGGQPIPLPLIRILPPDSERLALLDEAVRNCHTADWLLFTSANGVRSFMERLRHLGLDGRHLGSVRIAAVGPSTSAALESWHLSPDVTAASPGGEALAEALLPAIAGTRCVWPSADRARPELYERLTAAGAVVDRVVAYRHCDTESDERLRERFRSDGPDWICLSSPVIAQRAADVFPELTDPECPVRVASISPRTTQAAEQAGLPVHAEARLAEWDGLLAAIAEAVRSQDAWTDRPAMPESRDG